ncbi:CYFA0S06e03774g1_1 [Cyberlindnera fabianii]|uniref:CYFA0S06e03774g1_1 n=2 Tax=Cyberlindnera fabianii TaxID=36022 RepID=A0A061AVI9_CYBFA|nr:CYFA0S06e03774g1_1 [Cyberlindnera fabianii]
MGHKRDGNPIQFTIVATKHDIDALYHQQYTLSNNLILITSKYHRPLLSLSFAPTMSLYGQMSARPMSASLNNPGYRLSSRSSMNFDSSRPRSNGGMTAVSTGALMENNDDAQSTITGLGGGTRPSSSLGRYELYSQLSQSAPLISSSTGSFPFGSLLGKLNPSAQLTSHTLDQRISKYIKAEKKVMKQQQELVKDITSWCNIVPNEECKRLLYHYIRILEMEFDITEQAIKKQSQIIGQLGNVNKREKRTNDLKWKRNKILAKLRESENKVGDSPITMLTKENLEELECSVEIVEDQFIRSINTGLKNALVDYVMTLRNSGVKYKESSKTFLDEYNFSTKTDASASSLQKLILQNKYNGANSAGLQSIGVNRVPGSLGYRPYEKVDYSDGTGLGTENDNLAGQDEESGERVNKLSIGMNPTVIRTQGPKTRERRQDDDSGLPSALENFHIINSYSTPGALDMMPGGSEHQWRG